MATMAICKNGRETIERDDSGAWMPDPDAGPAPIDHDDHTPVVMVTVEQLVRQAGGPMCIACPQGATRADYRVSGDIDVCAEHLVSGVNIAIAYLATRGARP